MTDLENNSPESPSSTEKNTENENPVSENIIQPEPADTMGNNDACPEEILIQQQQIKDAQNAMKPPQPMQVKLPGSGAVLTLGILSIATISCWGYFIGPVHAIIALVLAARANKLYRENPDMYKGSSYGNSKAGKICAIIGLSIGAFVLTMWIIIFLTGTHNPQIDKIEEMYMQIWDNMNY